MPNNDFLHTLFTSTLCMYECNVFQTFICIMAAVITEKIIIGKLIIVLNKIYNTEVAIKNNGIIVINVKQTFLWSSFFNVKSLFVAI